VDRVLNFPVARYLFFCLIRIVDAKRQSVLRRLALIQLSPNMGSKIRSALASHSPCRAIRNMIGLHQFLAVPARGDLLHGELELCGS